MKKRERMKRSRIAAIITGIFVIGAGVVVLVNASGLPSIFEPRDFDKFENDYDSGEEYDSAAGDGEESDLADENEDGQDSSEGDTQKALQVAENETQGQRDEDGLGIADDKNRTGDSGQEKNPNAFEVTDNEGPGGIGVRPDDNNGNNGNDGNDGNNGNNPGDDGKNPGDSDNPGNPGGTDKPGTPDDPDTPNKPTNPDNPSSWEDEQLKPRDPVETEDGVLVNLSASINREYFVGDSFSGSDAKVTATFRQEDKTNKTVTLSYGGQNGYSVKLSTRTGGTHTAVFTYLGMTARAQYDVISGGMNIYYYAEYNEAPNRSGSKFPQPLGGDAETLDKLESMVPRISSGGIADLADIHSRMIAYLGDSGIKNRFSSSGEENNSDKYVIFLEEKDGYLVNMLCGFQQYHLGELKESGPYIYYPDNGDRVTAPNIMDVVKKVPDGYKIKRIVENENNLETYKGSQVLIKYEGDASVISVPMGVTAIALDGTQGTGQAVTSLKLPESVNEIDFESVAKFLPKLTGYDAEGRGIYQTIDGVLYSKDGKTLISVPAGKTSIRIPASVTAIAAGAFRNSSIIKLTIPSTVTTLEKGCFEDFGGAVICMEGKTAPKVSGDTGYKGKILFADSDDNVLMKQGMFAFQSQDITFGAMDEKGNEIPEKTGIYQYDSKRKILVLKNESQTLAGIPANIYGRYIVPDGVTAVERGAFAGVTGLRELELPAAVTEFREGSLVFSDNIESVTLSADKTAVSPMVFGKPGDGAKVPDIRIYVPKEHYDEYLKEWTGTLDSVYGSGTAERILQAKDDTIFFENDAKYQKITESGKEAYRLLKVYVQDATAFEVKEGTEEIAAGAFSLCKSLEIAYLPEGLKKVEDGAFKGCAGLHTVTADKAALLSGDVFDSSVSDVKIYEKGSRFQEFVYDKGIVYGKSASGVYTLIDVPTDYSEDISVYEKTGELNAEAFKDCALLKNITVPDQNSLTVIGDRCFENCAAITTIRLEKATQLKTVGDDVFRSCESLERLYLPDNLSSVGRGLCRDCTSLKFIWARGIADIPEEAFYNCQSFAAGNLYLGWDKITSIGDSAFAYCNVLSFVPEMPKLKSLGVHAFFTCQRLTEMVLPETLVSMGEECFGECSSLTQVTLNGKLTGISRYCFYGCRGLVKLKFGRRQKEALQIIGVQAFGQCTALESLDLSEFPALKQMGERTFTGCEFLTTVRFPENLTQIPDYCFEDCQNLSVLTLNSDKAPGLGVSVFGDTLSPFVHILVKETKLADYTNNYKKLLDDTYGSGTTTKILGKIDDKVEIVRGITFVFTDEGRVLKEVSKAFKGSYSVPVDTVRIESEAFMNCTGLTDIELPASGNIKLGDRCFKGCTGLKSAILRGNIPEWGDETFMNCTSMERLEIGNGSVERIGTGAFKNCTGLAGTTAVSFRAQVPVLGEECFAGCVNLEAVSSTESSRNSIEVIEDYAFSGCSSLKTFLTSVWRGVTTIGAYAFSDCDSVENLSVPASVTSIGEGCFSECDILATVSFYCALEEYPKNCFKNCPKLTRTGGVANALSGLKRIGESAYEGCVSLTTAENWSPAKYTGLEEIGANAFKGCTNMTVIELSSTVQKIGAGAFDSTGNVGQMTLHSENVPEIGAMALDTMSNSFCIRVPDSQADGDSIYKAYLAVFTKMFGESRAYELLDSISDGAKARNPMTASEESIDIQSEEAADIPEAAGTDEIPAERNAESGKASEENERQDVTGEEESEETIQ